MSTPDERIAELERRLDPRLLEVARQDDVVAAAIQAARHGTPLIDALAMAVLALAEWKRRWSPEATRAVMMQTPAPIRICCAGKHGDLDRALQVTPTGPVTVDEAKWDDRPWRGFAEGYKVEDPVAAAHAALAALTDQQREEAVRGFCTAPGCWRALKPGERCHCTRDE